MSRNERGHVVPLSLESQESLDATLELLMDPEAQCRVAQAQDEFARGESVTRDEMSALMIKREQDE